MILELIVIGAAGFGYAKGYRLKKAGKDIITGKPAPLVIR
jgi:hypothetical protein